MARFTFFQKCDVCGQTPVLKEYGMCAVCTHGTASVLWEWLDEQYKGRELEKAANTIFELMGHDEFMDSDGNWYPMAKILLKITDEVEIKMDELLDKYTKLKGI